MRHADRRHFPIPPGGASAGLPAPSAELGLGGFAAELPARAPPAPAPVREPFARRRPLGPHVADRALPEPGGEPAGETTGCSAEAPVAGVERRLVRRAEAVWEALCVGAALPPASAAGALLSAPFAAHALMFAFPPHPGDAEAVLPRIVRCGAALAEIGIARPGPVTLDGHAGAPAVAQLAMLAARAVALREPTLLERDSLTLAGAGTDAAAGGHLGAMLLRAVALPFTPEGAAGPLVVVIASWRRLLSEEETASLASELRAAIAALKAHG